MLEFIWPILIGRETEFMSLFTVNWIDYLDFGGIARTFVSGPISSCEKYYDLNDG